MTEGRTNAKGIPQDRVHPKVLYSSQSGTATLGANQRAGIGKWIRAPRIVEIRADVPGSGWFPNTSAEAKRLEIHSSHPPTTEAFHGQRRSGDQTNQAESRHHSGGRESIESTIASRGVSGRSNSPRGAPRASLDSSLIRRLPRYPFAESGLDRRPLDRGLTDVPPVYRRSLRSVPPTTCA